MSDPVVFTQNDYEIVKREVPCEGQFARLGRYHIRFRLFRGGWSDVTIREILERKSAVCVLPYDPILDKVILIEQFRAGALANPQSPWMLEIVAGVIESDDPPIEVAKREMVEEAGTEALDLYPICEYFVSPGASNEYLYTFCGRVDATNAEGLYGLVEEHEDIRAFSLSADQAFKMLQEGKIKTGPAIMALQWLQLNREWLKQLWQTK